MSSEEKIMDEAQVFASAWSMVGGPFDSGNAMDDAEAAKEALRKVVREVLAEASAPPPDTVTLLGVRPDGSSVNLGRISTPAKMKAREIVENYIGTPGDPADDFEDSEATQAYRCCLDVIEYMRTNGA